MKSMINTSAKVVKTYAQAASMSTTPVKRPQPTPSQDRATLHLLDEFSNRERRTGNLVIHSMPESQEVEETQIHKISRPRSWKMASIPGYY